MRSVDWFDFVMKMRVALFQCGRIAKTLKGKVERYEKKSDSPGQTSTSVTIVDVLCQEVILLAAYDLAPWIEVYGEDLSACSPYIVGLFKSNVGNSRYVLATDSLDGTDHYLSGGKFYAHMLGILDTGNGQMLCEMIYFPELEVLYLSIKERGAFVINGFIGQPERLSVPVQIPKTVHMIKRLTTADIGNFTKAGFEIVGDDKPKSSAIQMIQVIKGEVGALVMRKFHQHDTIGGLIIEELGGLILGENGQTLLYEKNMPRTPLVIASLVPNYAQELYAAQK